MTPDGSRLMGRFFSSGSPRVNVPGGSKERAVGTMTVGHFVAAMGIEKVRVTGDVEA
jgi:hypothetical protein